MSALALVPEQIGAIPGAASFVDLPPAELLEQVEFYAPKYMGPAPTLEIMAKMPNLKVCQLLTAGFENALPHLPAGAVLCNAAGVHDTSTAELAVGLTIAKLRGLDDFARAMPSGAWIHSGRDALADRNVIVIGAGNIGTAIRNRLLPFEVNLTMVGRTRRDGVRGIDELPSLLPTAQVVIVVVPLTPATRHLIDDEFLSALPDGALVVNVARGPVADTDAIVRHANRLRFALDVTDPEPLPADHELWQFPNVLISPHVGGHSSAFWPRINALVARQVAAWHEGRELVNVVSS